MIAVLCIAVLVIVGYLFVLHPRFVRVGELRARIARATQIMEAAAATGALRQLRDTLAAIPEADRHAIDALAPPGEDVPGIFVALDAAAQRAGVGISSMEATREEGKGLPAGVRSLSVGLSVRNVEYDRLHAFLRAIGLSQRLMDVRSVQFSPAGLTATIRIRAYSVE